MSRVSPLDRALPVPTEVGADAMVILNVSGRRIGLTAEDAERTAAFLLSMGVNPWPLFDSNTEYNDA